MKLNCSLTLYEALVPVTQSVSDNTMVRMINPCSRLIAQLSLLASVLQLVSGDFVFRVMRMYGRDVHQLTTVITFDVCRSSTNVYACCVSELWHGPHQQQHHLPLPWAYPDCLSNVRSHEQCHL